MTHFETARIGEILELQIGKIREAASKLSSDDLEQFERDLAELDTFVTQARSMVEGLPHSHLA